MLASRAEVGAMDLHTIRTILKTRRLTSEERKVLLSLMDPRRTAEQFCAAMRALASMA
jgi:hypothetical protein